MALWKSTPKTERTAVGGRLQYGESYGSYGFAFVNTWEGPRMPGNTETALTLRRVTPAGASTPELQMSVEIRQYYRSGANSRSMHGNITLRGEALREFCKRVLEEDAGLNAGDSVLRK